MNATTAPTLRLTDVRKAFGSARVLRGVDLEIKAGEFVGLMGPNGAGKSTLIKILDGIHPPTAGTITLGERDVSHLHAVREVGFVHQDLGLVDGLSITENLRLGEPQMRIAGLVLDKRAERAAAERALALVSLEGLAVDALVGSLSPAEKTLVAVARAFARGAQILFVDEATSTLPPSDAKRVVQSLAAAAHDGRTVVMVSHKLGEILSGPTRVVLLLDGRIVADRSTVGLDRSDLLGLLMSHEQQRAAAVAGEVETPADHRGDDPELAMIAACGGRAGPIDLEVRGGEVLGLTGLAGSGLHDVAMLAAGSLAPTAGEVVRRTPEVGLVPPHRETQGGFPDQSVRMNVTISSLAKWRRGRTRLLSGATERAAATRMATHLSIVPEDIEETFGVLSGGNKQKAIFARALLRDPGLFVLCEPTRGVDVDTRAAIYRLITSLKQEGRAVLVVSSDIEDLLAVCDRVASVQAGRVGELRPVDQLTTEDLEGLL